MIKEEIWGGPERVNTAFTFRDSNVVTPGMSPKSRAQKSEGRHSKDSFGESLAQEKFEAGYKSQNSWDSARNSFGVPETQQIAAVWSRDYSIHTIKSNKSKKIFSDDETKV